MAAITNANQDLERRNAVFGSWHSTPKNARLRLIWNMYNNCDISELDKDFNNSISEMDLERSKYYNSKIDVSNDLDNYFSDQHEICHLNNLGHTSDEELGTTIEEREKKECFVFSSSKRDFYAITWEDIAEATHDDEWLCKLRDYVVEGKTAEINTILNGKMMSDPMSEKLSEKRTKINPEDLTLYRNCLLVRDQIWAPKSLIGNFFT